MQTKHNCARRGFTLVELAIVMGILGLLLAGLFQLTSASARQINNQVTAQQLQQYIKAVKSWITATKYDSDGYQFKDSTGVIAVNFTADAVGTAKDVTAAVRNFHPGLPTVAPNGGDYRVFMQKQNPVGAKASYVVVTSIVGGVTDFGAAQLGSIANFTGAEGGAVYSPATVAAPLCGGSPGNVVGAYGGVCFPTNAMAALGIQNNRPATLSFLNVFDMSTQDANYLWRVNNSIHPEYNKMLTNMGMNPGVSLTFDSPGGGINTGSGSITMGTGGMSFNGATALTTPGGIALGGGTISTGQGTVSDLSFMSFYDASKPARLSMTTDPNVLDATGAPSPALYFAGANVQVQGTLHASSLYADSFIYTAGGTPSDVRLKENIKPLGNALDEILKIHGVSYRLKSNKQQADGVLAQDVEKVYPELVMMAPNGFKAVNYTGLIGPLIEAVRELKLQNDKLQARVDTLEAQVGNHQVKFQEH